jgi:hypothetical protein
MCGCRCYERLQTKTRRNLRVSHTQRCAKCGLDYYRGCVAQDSQMRMPKTENLNKASSSFAFRNTARHERNIRSWILCGVGVGDMLDWDNHECHVLFLEHSAPLSGRAKPKHSVPHQALYEVKACESWCTRAIVEEETSIPCSAGESSLCVFHGRHRAKRDTSLEHGVIGPAGK